MTESVYLSRQPLTLWLTGLSGSGKTTLAMALHKRMTEAGRACFVLDGDVVRLGLCGDLGFSPSERHENIRRVAEVARLMNQAGVTVVCALISPLQSDRDMARRIIGEASFLELHVATPLAVCEQRDPKGLYKRARAGEIASFTGISAPYEPPPNPALKLDTSLHPLSHSVELTWAKLHLAQDQSAD